MFKKINTCFTPIQRDNPFTIFDFLRVNIRIFPPASNCFRVGLGLNFRCSSINRWAPEESGSKRPVKPREKCDRNFLGFSRFRTTNAAMDLIFFRCGNHPQDSVREQKKKRPLGSSGQDTPQVVVEVPFQKKILRGP